MKGGHLGLLEGHGHASGHRPHEEEAGGLGEELHQLEQGLGQEKNPRSGPQAETEQQPEIGPLALKKGAHRVDQPVIDPQNDAHGAAAYPGNQHGPPYHGPLGRYDQMLLEIQSDAPVCSLRRFSPVSGTNVLFKMVNFIYFPDDRDDVLRRKAVLGGELHVCLVVPAPRR